jgi:hypothetical protein
VNVDRLGRGPGRSPGSAGVVWRSLDLVGRCEAVELQVEPVLRRVLSARQTDRQSLRRVLGCVRRHGGQRRVPVSWSICLSVCPGLQPRQAKARRRKGSTTSKLCPPWPPVCLRWGLPRSDGAAWGGLGYAWEAVSQKGGNKCRPSMEATVPRMWLRRLQIELAAGAAADASPPQVAGR